MKIFLIGNVASMMINFRKELITELSKDHEVFCLVSDYTQKDKDIIDSFGAIPLDYSLNSKGLNPLKDIIATINLYKIIKKHNPDIVFSFFVKPVIFSSIAAKFAKTKRVVGMIEGLGNAFTINPKGSSLKSKIIKFIQILLYKISLPLLDNLIFLQNDDKKDLVDKYKIKVKNIDILGGIGVDLDKFSYSTPKIKPIKFIFIARLLAQKGIFEYLEAAKTIKEKYKENVEFIILGSFDEKNPFSLSKKVLDDYIKSGIITYPGFVNNPNEWIKNSSVFVLPSYREGVPRSTQEAMAIGRAIITTNSVGCKETVVDGINGYLVPICDIKSLVSKMELFIKNPNLIDKMGKESRKIAEQKYNVKDVNKTLISFIFKE
ncbi:glycosyltransferase family 4 protein [Campylobacter ureolyticus]|uniref:Glycosyltransferase, family 1 n=1 Tax=Campylobacter ureolyticus TaxID=827 RepID=A0AAE7E9U5_9BACT|nr:glycosyltransferase family 4 protein [Campylobacter ureolyticus]MCR8684290.1 glycosyltransferase family 4 protein [Campylobacter ureolyticus]QKF84324.1 glycosyltransferase, family 1 [Campylobacter ureolyticus]QQY35520.1 glycosyltransferase family 4 protein [Campylobacter ureolyticus]SUX23250.1 RfpB [Campylobacter ureolyticus]